MQAGGRCETADVQRRRLLALLAVAVALAVAELGVLVLWPDGGVVTPDEVAAGRYFSAAQLERAADYRGPQLPIYVAQTLLGLVVLGLLVARPPRVLTRLTTGSRFVLLRVALAAAVVSLLLTVVAMPLGAVGRQRGIDVGLVTRSWPGWLADVALGGVIQAALMAAAAVALIALMRRAPRWWWAPASIVVVAGAGVVLYVAPVALDPLFNRFTPVEQRVRADVVQLGAAAGIEVGEVLSIDASKRTTAANAYVAGFGPTKRVVVYDTLLERFPRSELRFVLAHELAHQRYDDVPRGLAYVLLVAPFGLLAAALLLRSLAPAARADARTVPALALVLALLVPAITMISNQLSRRVEARADTFALQLTDDPQALIDFRRRSVVRNVSEPDPGAVSQWLLGTHPTALERIGAAEAWRRGARP